MWGDRSTGKALFEHLLNEHRVLGRDVSCRVQTNEPALTELTADKKAIQQKTSQSVGGGGLLSEGIVGRLVCTVQSRRAPRRGSHLSGSLDNQRIQMDPDLEEGHSVGRETASEGPTLETDQCTRGTRNELVPGRSRVRGGRFINRMYRRCHRGPGPQKCWFEAYVLFEKQWETIKL